MIKLFSDLKNYLEFKKKQKEFKRGIFIESQYIFKYLRRYTHKSILISFENINVTDEEKNRLFIFKTVLFRQLIFETLKIKYLYSSTPGLDDTYFKKSKVYNCKYIYLQHSPVGLINKYQKNAFNNFDVVQVINSFQKKDIQEINRNLKKKIKIFKSKYALFSKKIPSSYKVNSILIAPTWNSNFYRNNYHQIIYNELKNKQIPFSIRPHPMSLKKKEITIEDLKDIGFEIDNEDKFDFKKFNLLISDWSGIFLEYSYFTEKMAYLINSEQQYLNDNIYNDKRISIEMFARNEIAYNYLPTEIELLVKDMITKNSNSIIREKERTKVNKFFDEYFY